MKHAKAVRRIIFTVLIVAAVIVGFNTYTADYYHAKDYELQTTEVSETDAYIAYGDPQSETGLIFYPGAKVEETAYALVMDGLAQQGIFCVTVKMPAHLAILKPNAADEVRQEFGEVKRWYLAGHSLGGAMAGSYAAKHESELAGLIFLAAYPTRKLQTLPVLLALRERGRRFEYGKISGSNRSCGGLPRVCLRGRQPCRVRQLRIAEGRRRGRDYGQGAVAGNDRLHHGHDPAATGGKVAEPGE